MKIIVNGVEKDWGHDRIFFEDLTKIAGKNADATITYRSPNIDGTLIRRMSVMVEEKMVFNVVETGNA